MAHDWCVKLRYLISKFDVGELEGGLQSSGQSAGKRLHLSESVEAHEAYPEECMRNGNVVHAR